MPPVSPGQPSSFGSVFADSPGLLRENGFTTQFNIAATTAQMFAVCSGEASTDVTQFQPVIAPLGPGDSLNIFGVQGICASNGDPLMFAIKTGSKADDATNPTLQVGSSNRNGPWFQHFELPLKVDGPETGTKDVYIKVIAEGASASFNQVTLEVLTYRKP
tara:strand:+ start:412 stop:894 length:483 start_codon:yes stop_codon:yes gene_type:complete